MPCPHCPHCRQPDAVFLVEGYGIAGSGKSLGVRFAGRCSACGARVSDPSCARCARSIEPGSPVACGVRAGIAGTGAASMHFHPACHAEDAAERSSA